MRRCIKACVRWATIQSHESFLQSPVCKHLIINVFRICFQRSNWSYVNISSLNGLMPIKQLYIAWKYTDQYEWRHIGSQGHTELLVHFQYRNGPLTLTYWMRIYSPRISITQMNSVSARLFMEATLINPHTTYMRVALNALHFHGRKWVTESTN